MLILIMNNFINSYDKEEYKAHNIKASLMDINDILKPRVDFNFQPIVEEPMPNHEIDDNEPTPFLRVATLSLMADPVVHKLGFKKNPTFQ